MTDLIGSVPFFGLPIIRPVTRVLVNALVTRLVDATALGAAELWISVNISYKIDSVESATQALREMLLNPKGYNDEQSAQISKDFDTSARDLIKLSIIKLR